jgi:hypothetical protein
MMAAEPQRSDALDLVHDRPATPEPSSAPAPNNDIDDALAEYEAANPPPVEVDGEMQDEASAALRDMDASAVSGHADARIAELQNRNAALEAHIHREQESAAFRGFASDLQKQLPEHLPADYAETSLMALGAQNPELAFAWDNRNADRRAADLELTRVERALTQLQQSPNARPQQIAALTEYGYKLGLILNAPKILQHASAEIVRRGKAHVNYDPDLSADRMAVAAAVRGASGPVDFKEPSPDYSQMDSVEGRRKVKEQFGFDPAW